MIEAGKDPAEHRLIVKELNTDVLAIDAEGDNPTDGYFLIEGVKKICVLGVIKYRQVTNQLFDDVNLHPETKKALEQLHY